jgi:hypothetical protein
MKSLNLIPMWRRQQRRLRARRKVWVVAGCIYTLLLTVGYTGWRLAWSQDGRDLNGPLALTHHDVDAMSRSIADLRAGMGKVRKALQVNGALLGQPDFSILLALLGQLRGEEVILNRCELDAATKGTASLPGDPAAPPRFNVYGYGRSQAAVTQFALRLEQAGPFQSVSVMKSNREPFLSGEAVAFRIECLFQTDGPEPPATPATPLVKGKPSPGQRSIAGTQAEVKTP